MDRIKLEFPEAAIVHRQPLSVRITDMNYGRHLGHDTLISLLHEARIQAFGALGLTEWDMGGYPSVVADLAVQYQSEARWPDAWWWRLPSGADRQGNRRLSSHLPCRRRTAGGYRSPQPCAGRPCPGA
ncbi:acyl-CoA thioesterase [Halomonas sp. BC04]|uniref:acyl-CoA thioesterase n=1 Tax=Halomonas sp. BC04 TaxID=1403540 RepID=UPI0004BB35B7|nr:acyl-CoA thioesterase [Halomonas sp. BC04]